MSCDSYEQGPSNFALLESHFSGVIDIVREFDSTGQPSTFTCARKTYVLRDGTKLFITEYYTRSGTIDHYYYDWVNGISGNPILQFHSEPHDDVRYQTETEPFHIHSHHKTKLDNVSRLANHNHRDLFSVLDFIEKSIYAREAIE